MFKCSTNMNVVLVFPGIQLVPRAVSYRRTFLCNYNNQIHNFIVNLQVRRYENFWFFFMTKNLKPCSRDCNSVFESGYAAILYHCWSYMNLRTVLGRLYFILKSGYTAISPQILQLCLEDYTWCSNRNMLQYHMKLCLRDCIWYSVSRYAAVLSLLRLYLWQ